MPAGSVMARYDVRLKAENELVCYVWDNEEQRFIATCENPSDAEEIVSALETVRDIRKLVA